MPNQTKDQHHAFLEASRNAFLTQYELFLEHKTYILRNPHVHSAPLNWYISSSLLTSGNTKTSLSLGQLLLILEKLEARNEGKRIHLSWLKDEEGWNEILRFLMPEDEKQSRSFFGMFPRHEPQTPEQALKDKMIGELPSFPLYLSVEEVAEELHSLFQGREKKSEKLAYFWKRFEEEKKRQVEEPRVRVFSKGGSRVSVNMQCMAQVLRIPDDPGPVNFTWQKYDEERKALVREIGREFSVGIREKGERVNFQKTMDLDEMLARGPEDLVDWIKKVLETFQKEVSALNARYPGKLR